MLRTRLLPIAVTLGFVLADFSSAMALPVAPDAATQAAASSSQVQLARFGGRGGGFRGAGFHGGVGRGYGVGHRGYGFRGGGMYAGRYGGRYGYGRYGYGRGWGWGAAAAATGVGVAAATSPYWSGGYNCGPYQYYYPGYGCVNR